ncbi:MAG: GNAT family N-acetyltransferase [Anaerolineales bacterium]|nr:GNAT family N-acetyltransferase [Anaerolineales bacterium]
MTKIILRPTTLPDLPILFEQQLEAEGIAMSAYPAKDRGEFMRHWEGILSNPSVAARTILYKEKVAGHILCWKEGKYEQRVGYWIGKQFWGRGVASSAVRALLAEIKIRPLYAEVANHNLASRRVLEKNGFSLHETEDKISKFKLV